MISSLNADLQTTAYNSLGDRRGAVVVLEPSTGRILAMVSKPDFDPNTIAQNWDTLVNDESNSSLLNRATNGAYPPGSTFKIVTALDYFRQKGSLEGYSYLCQGSITVDDHTIQCYNGAVHGQEDFILHLHIPVTVHLQILELVLGVRLFARLRRIFCLTRVCL